MYYTSAERLYTDNRDFAVAVEYVDDHLAPPYYYEQLRSDGPVWVPALLQDSPDYDYLYEYCQDVDAQTCPMCCYYVRCRADGPVWMPAAV
jgi:hypothetical protein